MYNYVDELPHCQLLIYHVATQLAAHYTQNPMQKSQKTIIAISLLATFAYGGWAILVNYDHGTLAWIKAAAAQGTSSFLMTFFLTNIAHNCCHKYNYGTKGIWVGFLSSFVIMLSAPYIAHSISQTPNKWTTMAPGLIWGSIYIIGYLVTIDKKYRTTLNDSDKADNS